MAQLNGHTATLGGRVSIERLIARRERLKKVLGREEGNSAPAGEKRDSLAAELAHIEETLAGYKLALADL